MHQHEKLHIRNGLLGCIHFPNAAICRQFVTLCAFYFEIDFFYVSGCFVVAAFYSLMCVFPCSQLETISNGRLDSHEPRSSGSYSQTTAARSLPHRSPSFLYFIVSLSLCVINWTLLLMCPLLGLIQRTAWLQERFISLFEN